MLAPGFFIESLRKRERDSSIQFCQDHPEFSSEHSNRLKQYYRAHPKSRTKIAARMRLFHSTSKERNFADGDRRAKPVRCIETGVEYRSGRLAEKIVGHAGVHKACSGIQSLCGGYHLEFVNQKDRLKYSSDQK